MTSDQTLQADLAARIAAVLAAMSEAELLGEQAKRLSRLSSGDPAAYIDHTLSELQAINGELRVRHVTRPPAGIASTLAAALAIAAMLLGFALGIHYARGNVPTHQGAVK